MARYLQRDSCTLLRTRLSNIASPVKSQYLQEYHISPHKNSTMVSKFFYSLSYIGLLSILICAIVSCSTDEPLFPNDPPPETDWTKEYGTMLSESEYKAVLEETNVVDDCIKKYIADNESMLKAIATLSIVEKVDTINSIAKIHLKSGRIMEINLTPRPYEYPQTEIEEIHLEHMVDSIASLFNSDEYSSAVHDFNITPKKIIGSRSGANGEVRFLNRRNILLFSPDGTLRDEDIRHVRKAIALNRKNGGIPFKWALDSIPSYHPSYFRYFSDYDIVVVGCHGTPDGRLVFPINGMSDIQKRGYTSLAEHPEKTGVSIAREKATDINGQPGPIKGFYLGEKFFQNQMGSLKHTIIWCVKCYAGKILGEFRDACVVKKNTIEYFGPSQECLGKEVYPIFEGYLAALGKGMDSRNAFNLAPPKNYNYSKKLSTGGSYSMHKYSSVRYPIPEATGTIKKTRADKKGEPAFLGVRFRFPIDNNGNAIKPCVAGVKIVGEVGESPLYIPMNEQNTALIHSHRVGDSFVINDYTVKVSGLLAEKRYTYTAYVSDGENIYDSEESFSFTCDEATEILYIYTKEQFLEFEKKLFANKPDKAFATNVKLMTDIDLGDYGLIYNTDFEEYWSSDIPEELFYRGTFDGNGHSIKYNAMPLSNYKNQYIIPHIGTQGRLCNLKIDITPQSVCGINSIVRCSFGTIENCNINFTGQPEANISGDYGFVQCNIGLIQNCKVVYSGGFDRIIPLCFENKPTGRFSADSDRMLPELNGVPTIQNCEVIADNVKASEAHGMIVGYNNGLVENCVASGCIEDRSKGIGASQHQLSLIAHGICNTNSGVIRKCNSNCTFIGYQDNSYMLASGIAYCNSGLIDDCHYNGKIKYNPKTSDDWRLNFCNSDRDIPYYDHGIAGIAVINYNSNENKGGTVRNCTSSGTISTAGVIAAGICGQNTDGIIESSTSSMTINWVTYPYPIESDDFRTDKSGCEHSSTNYCVYLGQISAINKGSEKNCHKNGKIISPPNYHISTR